MDYPSIFLCLVLTWTLTHLLISKITKTIPSNQQIRLPPGPPTLPILGNLLSLSRKPHISLTKLANKYGPLMFLQLGQVPTVIISSASMAKEALHKNDLSVSSRMIINGTRALKHHENSLVWLPITSPQWRFLRKISNIHIFSSTKLDMRQSLRMKKVEELIDYVQNRSEEGRIVDIGEVAFTTTLNLLSNTFFSMDLVDQDSDLGSEFRGTISDLMDELGKPNFADYFPILQMIDPQGIQRHLSLHFRKMFGLFGDIIDQRLKGKRPIGSVQREDVLDVLLRIKQEKPEEFDLSKILHFLLDMFVAGTETISITLEWAMAELLRNPNKLKKTQEELEKIIGKGKSIKESDITRLPYLQAIVKETFRLHPTVPLLVPRKADSNLNLFGYTIPKNAQILVNVWAIGRDPELWENPNSFEPERFLGIEIDVKGRDFELIPFGAGRRICPGMPLAIRIIHLMLGSLIYKFDWKVEEGNLIESMDLEGKYGITLEKARRLRAIPILHV